MTAHLNDQDRPRPGANQTGAGSPTTQLGAAEESSMTYREVAPDAWVPRLGTMQELPGEQAALVRGLFQLAAWVCDHPELPIPTVSARIPSSHRGWNLVDQVAASFSTDVAVWFDRRWQAVEASFGPVRISCVAYEPPCLPPARTAR
jgi:hypothetical protein